MQPRELQKEKKEENSLVFSSFLKPLISESDQLHQKSLSSSFFPCTQFNKQTPLGEELEQSYPKRLILAPSGSEMSTSKGEMEKEGGSQLSCVCFVCVTSISLLPSSIAGSVFKSFFSLLLPRDRLNSNCTTYEQEKALLL